MAYAPYRSYSADLFEGMTDGTFKKYAPNRGGFPEPCSAPARRQMAGVWHGFNEVQPKVLADTRIVSTPNYLSVRPECRDH
jgi:hypothetical protein